MFSLRYPKLRYMLCAAAITIPVFFAAGVVAPARAQVSVSVGFDSFYAQLATMGTWSDNPRWGAVWQPGGVGSDFRPYYNGHWEDTDEYGWTWISNESWGDITYHYGRWVMDPDQGWLWVPGYVWAPAWVVWRSGGGNIGWFPMPPGDDDSGDGVYSGNYDNGYGYRDWYGAGYNNDRFQSMWTFVGEDHFRDRDFQRYVVPHRDYGRFIGQTRNNTNYTTVNNYIVNRSIDDRTLERDTHQNFHPVAARQVMGHNAWVTQKSVGRAITQREAVKHPVAARMQAGVQQGHNITKDGRHPTEPTRNSGEGAAVPGQTPAGGHMNANTQQAGHPHAVPNVVVKPMQPNRAETQMPGRPSTPPMQQQPAQQPAYQQPMQQRPAQQPAYQQPMQQRPAQQPAYQQPMQQRPAQPPAYQRPIQQRPAQQPAYQQPMQQRPAQQPRQQPMQQRAAPAARPNAPARAPAWGNDGKKPGQDQHN